MMLEVRQQDAIDLLRTTKDVAAIITDPPYGIGYHSNHHVGKNPHTPIAQDWNFQITPFLMAAADALRDGGAVYLCSRWDVAPLWVRQIPPTLALKNQIIWLKDNWSAGDLDGNFGNQYEVVLFLTKGRHKRRGHRWPNVWPFPRIPAKRLRMAAEKPVELFQRAIEASSDVWDLVVDPFCGSGTLGEAAKRANRRALLGDIDPAMLRITCERLEIPHVVTQPPPPPPIDPIFHGAPPEPHLWGLHPEDVQEFWSSRKSSI